MIHDPDAKSMPTRAQAEEMLEEAAMLNPGPWAPHSRVAAQAAELIARAHPDLEAERAFVLGLLHDIGRREGPSGLKHVLDGYRYLVARGFPEAARICLTHSFPVPIADSIFGLKDVGEADLEFLRRYLEQAEYTLYDKLIQLCDCLALPAGFCLIEKRMVDVALRYGPNPYLAPKWRAVFDIQAELERKIGGSVYSLLPGVVETTFGTANLSR
jgi:hypothetical protein